MPVDNAHPTRVRRACDGCRLRKVKCDGAQPCANCETHGIRCVGATLEPERRKNPIRGRLVAKARGEITGEPSPPQAQLPIIYPFNPAVSPADIFAAIDAMDESFEDAALVYAFGATTAFLTETSATMHGDAASQMNELLQYSLEAHRRVDLGPDSFIRLDETPLITNKRTMTSSAIFEKPSP
ncbi:putative transcriptional regulatory protein like [Verticillium longisporum]|nr:putative transcriptional regulatory protein like [Verticillium longisporum]